LPHVHTTHTMVWFVSGHHHLFCWHG